MRDLKELWKEPMRPLTQDEVDHFDEYMSFKNHSIPAREVSLTHAVDEILADIDYYLGFKKEERE